MKIALIHDYLNQLGGGERVLKVLMEMFPGAPIFTLMHDPAKTQGQFVGRVRGTSFLDFQLARDHHRLFIPFMPLAARSINLGSEFDLIISDTAGFAKGISYNSKTTKHLSYIHTPLRYAWETETYFDNSPKNLAMKILAAPAFAYVRHADYESGQRPDLLLANSHYIAEKIKNYYHRTSEVVYPPVDMSKFNFDSQAPSAKRPAICEPYYLAVGRLLAYKRFDLVIDAFTKLNLPLKIVGGGRESASLQRRSDLRTKYYGLSTNPIEFLGQVSEEQLRDLYAGAKALIMPNDEDFGLVMAEAQACGTPVIAYNAGGAREIVEEGKTGLLFNEQTPESLIDAVYSFEKMTFDPAMIHHSAYRFSRANFETGIREAINTLL